jgi:transcriptional regulator
MSQRADIMQGTLDLMVLRTLDTLGPMHGWGIAHRLEQMSDDVLRVNQGSLLPGAPAPGAAAAHPLEDGASENNRRARFYSITPAGRRQLVEEKAQWALVSGVINRLLASEE